MHCYFIARSSICQSVKNEHQWGLFLNLHENVRIMSDKPIALTTQNVPFTQLTSRQFEELIYALYKNEIETGSWKAQYDSISLMSGVGEKGRDCRLLKNGKNVGLLQCKHSEQDSKRYSDQECLKEVIKFIFYYFIDKNLIYDLSDFTYYYVSSTGFSDNADNLIGNFNTEAPNHVKLEQLAKVVIGAYKSFENLEYEKIASELKSVLSCIRVKKIIPQDLNILLFRPDNIDVLNTYFQVQKVVDARETNAKLDQVISFAQESRTNAQQVNESFNAASSFLTNYPSTFGKLTGSHIDRQEVKSIVSWIRSDLKKDEKGIAVVTGDAGIGKTVILRDVYLELESLQIPVLGIKSDSIYSNSIADLTSLLGFNFDLFAGIDALLNENEKVIFIIDQLDALSQSASTERKYLNVYNLLINKLIQNPKVRVIVSIRKFDLLYDSAFAHYQKLTNFKVDLLANEQVTAVIGQLNNALRPPSNLLQLLRTPNHLSVFCTIYNSETNLSDLNSIENLYDELLLYCFRKAESQARGFGKQIESFLYLLAHQMNNDRQISLSDKNFRREFLNEISFLKSNGVLLAFEDRLQFFHQTFIDYIFAKNFVATNQNLLRYIRSNFQSLYIRVSVKMILGFLRNDNYKKYIDYTEQILKNNAYRFHIKLIAVNIIGFEDAPTEEEKGITKTIIYKDYNLSKAFIETVSGKNWLSFLTHERIFEKLVTQVFFATSTKRLNIKWSWQRANQKKKPADEETLALGLALRYISQSPSEIIGIIKALPEFTNKHQFINRLLINVPISFWKSSSGLTLFNEYRENIKDRPSFYIDVLEGLHGSSGNFAFAEYKEYLHNKIHAALSHRSFDSRNKIKVDHSEFELIEKFRISAPIDTFNMLLDTILDIECPNQARISSRYYSSLAFEFTEAENKHHPLYDYQGLYYKAVELVKDIANTEQTYFNTFFDKNKLTFSSVLFRILLIGLKEKVSDYRDKIFEILIIYHKNNGFSTDGKKSYLIRKLLTLSYPVLTQSQKTELNKILLNIQHLHEYQVYTTDTGQKKHWLKLSGSHQYKFLTSIPRDEILLHADVKKRFFELERKFKNTGNVELDEEPRLIRSGVVGPPLSSNAYKEMSLQNWLDSFKKYSSEESSDRHSFRGGVVEHSRAFQDVVKKNPKKFAPLIEQLIEEWTLHPAYVIAGITGLKDAAYDITSYFDLYKSALPKLSESFDILQMLWNSDYLLRNGLIDDIVIDFMCMQAISNPNPSKELNPDNIDSDGINSVRGYAYRQLLRCLSLKIATEKIIPTIEHGINDPFASVRAIILDELAYMLYVDKEKTLSLFLRLVQTDDIRVLKHSFEAADYLINHYFVELYPYFEKCLVIPELQPSIAAELSIAWLKNKPGSLELLKKLKTLNAKAKAKVIEVAYTNMETADTDQKKKCMEMYLWFLDDESQDVSNAYNHSFYKFSPENMNDLYGIFTKYTRSKAASKASNNFIEFLLKCTKEFPDKCLFLLKSLLDNVKEFNDEDYSFGSDHPIQIATETYNQLYKADKRNLKAVKQCLNLFDRMLKMKFSRSNLSSMLAIVDT